MEVFGFRLSRFLVFALVMAMTCHCKEDMTIDGVSEEDRPATKSVTRANTAFTADLYHVLKAGHPNNLIFSSFSLSSVIAMVKAGARGKTATEIKLGMNFPDDDVLNRGYRAIQNVLKSDGDFTLETANRVYAKTGFALQDNFTKTVKDYFNAEVKQLDFNKNDPAAKEINGWVEGVTKNKIKNLISPSDLGPLTRLVLVNAIYFKGLWKNKFDKNETVKAPFYSAPGKEVQVDMMKLEADLPYIDIPELKAKAVAMPYRGGKLSMIIVLPDEKFGLAAMEAGMKTFNLAEIPNRLAGNEKKVSLSLPRFKLESTIDLKEPLTQLGMGSMFDSNAADFSGMPQTKEPLYISKAVQKAFIEVNEEGSEAAAATAVMLMGRSMPADPEQVTVDHPFFFMIKGFRGLFLFSGFVQNPNK